MLGYCGRGTQIMETGCDHCNWLAVLVPKMRFPPIRLNRYVLIPDGVASGMDVLVGSDDPGGPPRKLISNL